MDSSKIRELLDWNLGGGLLQMTQSINLLFSSLETNGRRSHPSFPLSLWGSHLEILIHLYNLFICWQIGFGRVFTADTTLEAQIWQVKQRGNQELRLVCHKAG